MSVASQRVAVVGSGFVGVSCALHLQRAGYAVTLIDAHKAGSTFQASYGNAGIFATYANLPINKPGILWAVPGMLADPDGPLAIRISSHLPKMTPWGARFLAASRKERVQNISQSLSKLLLHAESGWQSAFEHVEIDIDKYREKNGALFLLGSEASYEAAQRSAATQRLSCKVEVLGRKEVAELEPAVTDCYVGGLYYDIWHLLNPGSLVAALVEGFEVRGGQVIHHNATHVLPGKGVMLDSGQICQAEEVVIAAGAHSKPLAASIGDKIPLDTERGYSILFPGQSRHISRPVAWGDSGFFMTPMAQGLRIAGTVELGGMKAPMNLSRCEMLERQARKLLPGLGNCKPEAHWLGFRPTLPDCLPVIGRSPAVPGVTYAFGHQHIGWTLAGITGQLVREVLQGECPSMDLHPYRPERFSEYIDGESLTASNVLSTFAFTGRTSFQRI